MPSGLEIRVIGDLQVVMKYFLARASSHGVQKSRLPLHGLALSQSTIQ